MKQPSFSPRHWTLLTQYMGDVINRIGVSITNMVDMPTVGRVPSQSNSATPMGIGDPFGLVQARYDADAQGGRGDVLLTLAPLTPQIYTRAEASVNHHGYALTFSLDGKQVGNFMELVGELLKDQVKPGVTVEQVIDFAAKDAARREYEANKGSSDDYGTW